jgi:hypothetical protein
MWRAVTVLECASRKRGFLVHSLLLDRLIFRDGTGTGGHCFPSDGLKARELGSGRPG